MRRAFSFVEAVVGMGILVVIGLAVTGALTSSAKEVKTSGEYSLSMFLSQKIVEDLIQSTFENERYEESMLDVAGSRIPVGLAVHPYFSVIEDTKDPLGVMQPGLDAGVDSTAPDLLRLYGTFALTVRVTAETLPATPSGTPQVNAVDLRFDWPGLQGAERDYHFPIVLPRPQALLEPRPLLAQDLPGMDATIRELIYPAETGDLPTAVSKWGASLTTVRDVGAVMALSKFVADEDSRLSDSISVAESGLVTAGPNVQAQAEGEIQIGVLYEKRAAMAWFVLLFLKAPALQQSTSFVAADVGPIGSYDRPSIVGWLTESVDLLGGVQQDLVSALQYFTTARTRLGTTSARQFRRMRLEKKILELLKLRAMLEQQTDLSYLTQWLDHLINVHAGRTRSFADYLTRERVSSVGLATLEVANPVVAQRANDARIASSALGQLASRVAKELPR